MVQVVASSNPADSTHSNLPLSPVKRLHRVLQCLCAAGVAAASGVLAQGYPAHPVKIVVPFAAGGVADITARVLSQKISESMGQQVIVENRPSAGGIVASEAVAKAEPDGYTLLFITNGNAVSASLFNALPYDTVKDFAPVSTVGFFDLVLIVDSASKIGSVRELIAYAGSNPNKLNIGTINIGSTQNLAAELFKSLSGIDAQVVPFKTTPAVITALKGGDVQAAVAGPVAGDLGQARRIFLAVLFAIFVIDCARNDDKRGFAGGEMARDELVGPLAQSDRTLLDRGGVG